MFDLGPGELLIIALIVLLIFGPKRLPELGKGIGQFISNFKSSMKTDPVTPAPSEPKKNDAPPPVGSADNLH
jgi:sec-independent protein translocase protein TatA